MDDLLRWRSEFPILGETTYLISNSLGAMPRSVYKKMNHYAEIWATRGVRAWEEEWWEMPVKVGDLIAPLIGANAGEVSMHQNVSLLQAVLISCFDFRGKRNKVVYSDMEFPSVTYVYEQLARERGGRIETVYSEDGVVVPLEKLLAAIDERTLLVPISHVLFKSAYIQNVKAIVEKAQRVGATVILDAYHSVGTIPVDVKELEVDILVGGVLKWLCGGPGAAFLYVRPGLRQKLQPKITGWMAHPRPFDFEVGHMEYREDAYRFLNGTPSIPTLYAAQEGPKIIREVGIENIRAKSIHQTSRLIALADELGFKVNSPRKPEERAGTVSVDVPNGEKVAQELLRRNILIDYRPKAGIRIAPHFYTKDEELEIVMGEMKSLLQRT
jgi:kynureninase